MPNWCSNSIVITGDKDKIKKIKRVLSSIDKNGDDNRVFQSLVGRDETLSEAEFESGAWYNSNINRFGCKWDVDYDTCNFDLDSDDCITMSPETAWSPPEGFCRLLAEQYGVDVVLEYSEPGCDFAGRLSITADGDEEADNYAYLEGLYYLDESYFWMEVNSNLEYEFDDEPRSLEEWLEDFTYVSDIGKKELISLYEEVREQYQETN
jgi:hypothetical protein